MTANTDFGAMVEQTIVECMREHGFGEYFIHEFAQSVCVWLFTLCVFFCMASAFKCANIMLEQRVSKLSLYTVLVALTRMLLCIDYAGELRPKCESWRLLWCCVACWCVQRMFAMLIAC